MVDPVRRSAYDAELRKPKPKRVKPQKAAKVPEAPKPPKPAKAVKPPKPQTPIRAKAPDTNAPKITKKTAAVQVDPEHQAFGYARDGGLVFALGGLASALTYLYSTWPHVIAWAPLIAGVVGLAWWSLRYVRLRRAAWRPDHLILLGGLIMFGLVSAGWVRLT